MGIKNILACGDACATNNDAGATKKSAAERIFDTARELFYHRGIRAVGVDEIVCQAGVTKPSLYRAYASKDALVAACLQASAREGREAMAQVLADAPDDPREKLRAIIAYYAAGIAMPDFRGCPMSNTAVEFPEPGHPARAVAETCKSDMRDLLGTLTRKLGVRDPEALADGLLLIVEGAWASHHIFGSQGPANAMVVTADALIEGHLAGVPA